MLLEIREGHDLRVRVHLVQSSVRVHFVQSGWVFMVEVWLVALTLVALTLV